LEGYSRLIEELKTQRERASSLSIDQAMVETLSIGRYVIKHILLDPLLPKALLATDDRYRSSSKCGNMIALDSVYGRRSWLGMSNNERAPDVGSHDRRRVPTH